MTISFLIKIVIPIYFINVFIFVYLCLTLTLISLSFKISNIMGVGVMLDRITTTITDSTGERRGDDEIIMYVPDCLEYDTDFLHGGDCATLHFTPAQAKELAGQLWALADGMAKPQQPRES